jgi:hypothetical protein
VILDTFLDPQDAVFDFTNSPGLFHYLIDRQSPTRYLHVSLAIRSDTQDDLVQELAQNRPKIVVFSSSGTGLPSWDGIANQVRHYRVSDYLLSHYRPLFRWNGFVFWGLRGIDFPPASILAGRIGDAVETKNLHFRGQPCDWGYAPNFLVEGPRLSARPLRLATRELGALVSVAGWAIDPEAQTAASKVVAAIGGRVVAQNTPADYRPDIEAHLQNAAYRHSGFTLGVRLPSAMEVRSLRIYAVSRSGTATELAYAPSAAWGLGRPPGPRELRIGQRKIRVLRGRTDGFADSSTVSAQLLRLDVPPSIRGADYRWLEVRSRSPLLRNGFMLSDRTSDLARGIFFRTVGRGEYAVRVYVGACSQWHGYRARRLYLRIDRRQAIEAVRLYR